MENFIVERRKHKRVDMEAVVELKLPSNPEKFVLSGRVKDISLGGLKFESCQKLEPKEIIIGFGNDSFLNGSEITGKIVRTEKDKLTYMYGVEFQELRLKEKAKIWYKTAPSDWI